MKSLFVLSLCVLHVAYSQVFPVDQVTEYNYEALVQVVTKYPTLHTSEYMITAQLFVTGITNGAFVSFKDVTQTLYAKKGNMLDFPESDQIGFDPESELLHPFVITYDKNGTVERILTDKSEKLWSVNIKKGIASLLQLDIPQVTSGNYGFYVDEQTVHGNCKVQYSVTPSSNGRWKVYKHHNTFNCDDFKMKRVMNLFSPQCDSRRGEVLTISSERYYDVQTKGDVVDINRIESFNSIMFNPFFNNDQNIYVNQTLRKLSTKKLSEKLNLDMDSKASHKLKNHIWDYDLDDDVFDATGGRQNLNQEFVMKTAMESLKNIFNYMQQNQIHLSEKRKDETNSISVLFLQLKFLNLKTLESFYKTLSEEKGEHTEELVELFLQALPFAGSYSSNLFIRNLIKEKKVSDKLAVKMLQDVPFYVKNVNKKVLANYFELVNEKDLSKEVLKASLLSFATMVNSGVDRFGEDDVDMEKYINFYLDKFKQAKDEEYQTFYLHTLKNLGTDKVAFYLENLLKSDKPGNYYAPYSKVLVMWALRTKFLQYPGKVNTVYWPLLVNQEESFEVRAAALQILLISATMSDHMKLYWFMENVDDYELYNSYYTMLVEFTKTTGSCYEKNSQRARSMLEFVKKPENPTISQTQKVIELAELFDAHYGFGIQNQVLTMGNLATKGFLCMDVQQSPRIEDLKAVKQFLQLRFKVNDKLQNLLKNQQTDVDISQLVMTSTKEYELELELVSVRHGRIASVVNYNMETLRAAYQKLKERRDSSKGLVNYVLEEFVGEDILFSTDLGVPFSLFYKMPALRMSKTHFGPGQSDKGTMTWKFTYDNYWWYQHKTGLAVFNPFANLWHINQREFVLDVYLPVDIEAKFGAENSMKMTLSKGTEKSEMKRGFQSHVHNHLFLFSGDKGEIIKKMCRNCDQVTLVTNNENILNKGVLFDKYVGDIKYEHSVFDCERNVSEIDLEHMREEFPEKDPEMRIMSAMKYWRIYDRVFRRNCGKCGIGLWYELKANTST